MNGKNMNKEKNIKSYQKITRRESIFNNSTYGITLIALVVTIVALLILASVSITAVFGDNGILSQAQNAAENYDIASEREYLEQNILAVQIGKYTTSINPEKLGEELNTRNLANSSDWHIIKVNDKTYDKGWNYIEKETELKGYGKAEYNWLVNYETGEIIQLEEDNYISLSAGDMLAVKDKDSLIINVDSSIIDENVANEKTALEKQLGDGVELVNFNYDGNSSGLTGTSFNFDGVNDYIKVPYNSKKQKDALAKNGFTFEFYGIWDGGTTCEDYLSNYPEEHYTGVFCYWSGEEKEQAQLRFGINKNDRSAVTRLIWNAGKLINDGLSDFAVDHNNFHNIYYTLGLEKLRQGCYITVTLDTSNSYTGDGGKYQNVNTKNVKNEEYYKQTVYIDGEILYQGDYNKKQWDNFISNYLEPLKFFCIGRSSYGLGGWWHYSKMNVYSLRLYSRALSEEEVMKNYEKSVEYHSLLTQKQ